MNRLARPVALLAGVLAEVLAGLLPGVLAATPARAEPGWYRGNTHAHTRNSDGDSAPDVVARWYRDHGYQFLFVTDHEHVTDPAPLNAALGSDGGFLVLPGQEITQWCLDPTRATSSFGALGAPAHVNALFARAVIRPRGTPGCSHAGCGASAPPAMPAKATIDDNLAAVRAAGALGQINHPNLLWAGRREDYADAPDGTLIEIWNGAGRLVNNLGGAEGPGDMRPSAEAVWDWLLSRGKVIWGVGADDSHSFTDPPGDDLDASRPGRAWIVVRAAALSAEALHEAIAAGQFYASTGVTLDAITADARRLTLTIRADAHQLPGGAPRFATRFVGRDGRLLATVAGTRPTYRFRGDESYVRAVITDSDGTRAWTQPVFRDGRRERSPYGG